MKQFHPLRALMLLLLALTCHVAAVAQEPYAVKSTDGTTLTFYFDKQKAARAGTVYGLGVYVTDSTGNNHSYPSWAKDDKVTSVTFDASFKNYKPVSISSWFWCMSGITSIDFTNFNTSALEITDWAFFGCSGLKTLDLSAWDTSHFKSIYQMFMGCGGLTSLNLSGWHVDNLSSGASFQGLFTGCYCLQDLDLTGWNPKGITSMAYMFATCFSLTSLNLSGWDVSDVTSMNYMFSGCDSLKELNLSGWVLAGEPDLTKIFSGLDNLTTLDASNWNFAGAINLSSVFSGLSKLTTLNLSGCDVSNALNMSQMFDGCSSLISLDLSGWDVSHVSSMQQMFSGCLKLASLNLDGWETQNVIDMNSMFSGCASLTSIPIADLNTSSARDMRSMFSGCQSLTSLDLSAFDTHKVTDMSALFQNCTNLRYVDAGFDTGNVTDMSGMFSGCSALTNIVNARWNTGNVERMDSMFQGCKSLRSDVLNALIRQFDTGNTSKMESMFSGCASADTIDVSGFDVTHVQGASNMFSGCTSLTGVDVSKWDPIGITYTDGMFKNCTSLTSIDFSELYLGHTEVANEMFSGDVSLKFLNIGSNDFLWSKEAENVFLGVGSPDVPCRLTYKGHFNEDYLGDPVHGVYSWLGGYFLIPQLALPLDEDKDNSDLFATVSGQWILIDTRRTFHAGRLNTICYPFGVVTDYLEGAFGDDYQLYELYDAAMRDSTLTLFFRKYDDDLVAGTPYVLRSSIDATDPSFYSAVDMKDNAQTIRFDGGTVIFHGVSWPDTLVNGDKNTLFLRNDTLYYPETADGDSRIYGQRGYFTVTTDSGAKPAKIAMQIDDQDGTDGIKAIAPAIATASERKNSSQEYNLTGQRVTQGYKGIIISKGKKHIQR